jgi:hypothetical protein
MKEKLTRIKKDFPLIYNFEISDDGKAAGYINRLYGTEGYSADADRREYHPRFLSLEEQDTFADMIEEKLKEEWHARWDDDEDYAKENRNADPVIELPIYPQFVRFDHPDCYMDDMEGAVEAFETNELIYIIIGNAPGEENLTELTFSSNDDMETRKLGTTFNSFLNDYIDKALSDAAALAEMAGSDVFTDPAKVNALPRTWKNYRKKQAEERKQLREQKEAEKAVERKRIRELEEQERIEREKRYEEERKASEQKEIATKKKEQKRLNEALKEMRPELDKIENGQASLEDFIHTGEKLIEEVKDCKLAVEILKTGYEIFKKDKDLLRLRASAYLNLKNYSTASALAAKLTEFYPDYAEGYRLLGSIAMKETSGYSEKAEENWMKAFNLYIEHALKAADDNDAEKSLFYLEKAAGMYPEKLCPLVSGEQAFDFIRENERFRTLIQPPAVESGNEPWA